MANPGDRAESSPRDRRGRRYMLTEAGRIAKIVFFETLEEERRSHSILQQLYEAETILARPRLRKAA